MHPLQLKESDIASRIFLASVCDAITFFLVDDFLQARAVGCTNQSSACIRAKAYLQRLCTAQPMPKKRNAFRGQELTNERGIHLSNTRPLQHVQDICRTEGLCLETASQSAAFHRFVD
nr:hypothetical protein [Silvibacterium dinghuense]